MKRSMETITKVAHWFPNGEGTFIRVFGSYKTPHALPRFATNRVLMQEVCYQMTQGFLKTLRKGKKKPWPAFPLIIRAYTVENFKEVEAEDKELKGYHFVNLNHCTYDLERVVAAHCKRANFNWSYPHSKHAHEYKIRDWYHAARELSPSEQQERDDEQLEHSQANVSLQERSTSLKRKKERQKVTGKVRKHKDKEMEDLSSDQDEGEDDETLEQRNATLARKKKEIKRKRKEELKRS